jgi:glycosyltransferase involved in cell wall biosynthesis
VQSEAAETPTDSRTIAIVVITHSRVELLRQCVENVLMGTSPATTEVVIWNNASTDGTKDYLDSLRDPRIRIVHHSKNIGSNAYEQGFRLTSAQYLVDLDDDVTGAPPEWDRILLDAYDRIPQIGFLAADLEEDDNDVASRLRHRDRARRRVEASRPRAVAARPRGPEAAALIC